MSNLSPEVSLKLTRFRRRLHLRQRRLSGDEDGAPVPAPPSAKNCAKTSRSKAPSHAWCACSYLVRIVVHKFLKIQVAGIGE